MGKYESTTPLNLEISEASHEREKMPHVPAEEETKGERLKGDMGSHIRAFLSRAGDALRISEIKDSRIERPRSVKKIVAAIVLVVAGLGDAHRAEAMPGGTVRFTEQGKETTYSGERAEQAREREISFFEGEWDRTEEARGALESFFYTWDDISIKASLPNTETDSLILHDVIPTMQEKAIDVPVVVHGRVSGIRARQSIENGALVVDGHDCTEDGEPLVEWWRDDNGNAYCKLISTKRDGAGVMRSYMRTIDVTFPLLLQQQGQEEGEQPLQLDFRAYGGEIPVWMMRTPEKLYGTEGSYQLYSNMDEEQARSSFPEEKLRAFTDGLREAEELFGYAPSDIVKNIYLPNTSIANAQSHGETVALFDEAAEDSQGALHITGVHEAVHSVDASLGVRRNTQWQGQFIKLSSTGFLHRISEHFFWGGEHGIDFGHAADDPAEFFASFLTSTTHPRWEERMRVMGEEDSDFLTQYYETLEVMRNVMEGYRGSRLENDALIFSRMNTLLDTLRMWQEQGGARALISSDTEARPAETHVQQSEKKRKKEQQQKQFRITQKQHRQKHKPQRTTGEAQKF